MLNFVPKTGGNTFNGSFYVAGFNDRMVSSNYSQTLRDAGLSVPPTILKLWDYTAGAGGPIKKDRMWFFANYRDEGSYLTIPGMFANANFNAITSPPSPTRPPRGRMRRTRPHRPGTPIAIRSATLASPCKPRRATSSRCSGTNSIRASGPPGPRRAMDVATRRAPKSTPTCSSARAPPRPKRRGYAHRFQRVQQATWTSPLTNRLLLEAGVGTYLSRWGTNRRPDSVTQDLVRVTEGCNTGLGCLANGGIAGLTYRSEAPFDDWIGAHTWRASASVVTGAHQMKFGYQGAYHVDDQKNFPNSTSTTYTFQNGSPPMRTARSLRPSTRSEIRQRVRYDAFYAQEEWTVGRATLQGAVRYDYARSFFPDQQIGPVRFLTTPVVFAQDDPAFSTPNAGELRRRAGGLRGHLRQQRHGVPRHHAAARPGVQRLRHREDVAQSDSWQVSGVGEQQQRELHGRQPDRRADRHQRDADVDRRQQEFCPRLRARKPRRARQPRRAGGDLCGVINNQNFGKPVFTNSFDSSLMGGWGVRPSDWSFHVSVQQQILPRTSVEIGIRPAMAQQLHRDR